MTDLSELRHKLAVSSRILCHAGLIDYSGHVSVRVPGSDHLLIFPHPVSRANVRPDDMVVTDLEGTLVEGSYRPPSEVFMHAGAYRRRPDVVSVAHLHNRSIATLSMVDRPFAPASSNPGAFFGPGVLPKYWDPALIHDLEQGDAVAETMGDADAVMLRGHGSMVVGTSIEWAVAAAIELEEAALRFCSASLLGEVVPYSDAQTERVMEQRRKDSVVQKIWDHHIEKSRLAGMMDGA